MGYVTTGSSNSVTNGSALELDIIISQDKLKNIFLAGVFTIENIDAIASGDDLKNLTCELWAKIDDINKTTSFPVEICEFIYDANQPGTRSYSFPKDYKDKYTYLIIKIRSGKCTVNGSSAELRIKFKAKNDITDPVLAASILFTVIAEQAKPEIVQFWSDVTVVQSNVPVKLSWEIKGEKYMLREGLHELQEGDIIAADGNYTIKSISGGDHSYTLVVKQGSVFITRVIQVRALSKSKLYSNANPTGNDSVFKIGNFCVSQDSSWLFSLMLKTENNKTQIDHIGYTNTNEGFSDNWSKTELSDEEKNCLKPFATSPLLHMKGTGELHGHLFFIGGSYIKPMETNNAVAIINLDAEMGSRVAIIDNLPWSSRMGHSCALFPHGDQDKIWLMGGVDEWGGALNDIWVSGDGKGWDNINLNGSVNTNKMNPVKMPWTPRCAASVTVELGDDGLEKALWIGGGFSETGGIETPGIWKWEAGHWTEITPLTINNGSYLSSGISFLGKDTIDSTGVFLLGGYRENENKRKYFYRITLDSGMYETNELDISSRIDGLTTTKYSKIITALFKGCLWYMVLTNEGDSGITYSKLFYWVPVATSQTLILT